MNKKIKFRVNGKKIELEVPTNRLLIDCLRYDLGLTGTKEGCSVGVCGSSSTTASSAVFAHRARSWRPRRFWMRIQNPMKKKLKIG